jgi:endonuclease G
MMMQKAFVLIAAITFAWKSLGQQKNAHSNSSARNLSISIVKSESIPGHNDQIGVIDDLEIPLIKKGEVIIRHTGFSLLYNEKHEQASWVAYELTKDETNRLVKRVNKFRPDPKVKSGTARDEDYKGSGYDRGHLAPAADMGWSVVTMTESFYYSNMSPQVPGFNRGIWKKLEEKVRDWAIENDAVYIVTGPILRDSLPTMSSISLSIPEYYYKVILDYRAPVLKAIGFIMPNESSALPVMHYAVSIDEVEAITGIDFFHSLPDDQETELEKHICKECWE